MAPPTAPATAASAPVTTSFEEWCERLRRVPDEWAWECYRYEVLHASRGA